MFRYVQYVYWKCFCDFGFSLFGTSLNCLATLGVFFGGRGRRSTLRCVYWYGDVTKEDLQAAIRMVPGQPALDSRNQSKPIEVKPGDNSESVTYVWAPAH